MYNVTFKLTSHPELRTRHTLDNMKLSSSTYIRFCSVIYEWCFTDIKQKEKNCHTNRYQRSSFIENWPNHKISEYI